MSDRTATVLAVVFWVFVLIAIAAILIGINYLRAGGDWGCVFTQEPQICVAVKGVTP